MKLIITGKPVGSPHRKRQERVQWSLSVLHLHKRIFWKLLPRAHHVNNPHCFTIPFNFTGAHWPEQLRCLQHLSQRGGGWERTSRDIGQLLVQLGPLKSLWASVLVVRKIRRMWVKLSNTLDISAVWSVSFSNSWWGCCSAFPLSVCATEFQFIYQSAQGRGGIVVPAWESIGTGALGIGSWLLRPLRIALSSPVPLFSFLPLTEELDLVTRTDWDLVMFLQAVSPLSLGLAQACPCPAGLLTLS